MSRPMKLPSDLPLENVLVTIDSREQTPFDLHPLPTVVGTLQSGDYGLAHLPHAIALERKSIGDFVACCGTERSRFTRELDRLRAYPARAVICEFSYVALERGEWRGKVTPASAIASVARWTCDGIPFLFANDHDRAGKLAARMLYLTARQHYRACRDFLAATTEVATA
jgi:ERCC4-type nuclease